MAKQIIGQNTFTTGVISPRLYSRVDVDEFKKAVAEATNAIIEPHGPITRRTGTKYVAHCKDHSTDVRLVRYQFSQDVAYILEFGNQYIRVYTSDGQVLESDLTITGITAANPAVVTSVAHGLSNGDHVYITEVVGMTQINNSSIPYKVANVAANTFELQDIDGNNINSSAYTAYSSGGVANAIFEITTTYTTAQVADLQYVQTGATLYIAHPDVAPKTLVSTAATSWTLSTVDVLPPPTYESGYAAATTMTPAATTGTGVNFTAGAATFLDGDVGRQIVNLVGAGRASIVSITSTTVAVCDIVENFPSTSAIASGDWKLDLSPIVDLEFSSSAAGTIATVRSEFPSGTVGSPKTITGITQANPAVVTSNSHGFVNGDKVLIQDVVGMTQVNDHIFTVSGVAANTFNLLGENSTGYTAYASAGTAKKVYTDIICPAFRSADIGKYIIANGGVLQIIAVGSSSSITAEVLKSLNSTDATGLWSLETATWTADRGYPRAVGLFQQRLLFGGTDAQPQTVWASEVGLYDAFGVGPDDEDSIETEIVSDEVNQINWLSSGRDLVVGSSGGEATISSGTGAGISPSSLLVQPRTYLGSRTQQVDNIKEEILFIQGSERKIRTFRYNFNIDGYESEDLTYLVEHLTEGGLKELAYAQEPDTTIYVVHNDGYILAGVYDRGKRLIGWSKFETDGFFKNIQTITAGEVDQVWMVVRRKINGTWRRYVEVLSSGNGVEDTDAFADSHLILSTAFSVSSITLADPAVITTSTNHGLSNGDSIVIKNIVDPLDSELDEDKTNMSSINGNIYTVSAVTATTFAVADLDTSAFNAYGDSGQIWKRVTALSGLKHLEGKSLSLRVDGAVAPAATVSGGAITLSVAGGEVVAGLGYTTTIKTLDLNFDSVMGPMQGQRVRWSRPQLRVYNSTKPLLNGEYLPNRNSSDLLGQAVNLYSGFLEYGGLEWSNTAQLTITVSDPLPLHLTGIIGTIEAGVK